MADAVTSTTGSSAASSTLDILKAEKNPSKAEAGSQKLSEDFDSFLLLLTTQLKNQDPTDPMDTNEFTNQLVQFSVAEQAINTNQNLEELIELQKGSQFEEALGYIGKAVDAKGNAGELNNGFANFLYELDAPANTVNIVISDGAGRAVFSGQGPTDKGKNRVVWNGVNSFTGQDELNGTYFINIVAKNASGETITSKTLTTGIVTSAEMQGENMMLNVAGTSIKISDIDAVRVPTQVTTTNPPADDGEDETVDNTTPDDETVVDETEEG